MATQIKLRRDTYQNWYDNNPILAEGEPGYDLTNKKLKIGDGVALWRALPYFDDQVTNFSAVSANIVPDTDNTRDLGAPDKQWRHVYTAGGSIYLDDIKLSNVNGKFIATKVINPGEVNEQEDPEDSDATSDIRGGGGGLGSITVPAVPPTLYKGLQVSYGVVHSNNNSDEFNVNKIVIHKPTTVTVTIDPTGNNDDFRVSGLADSDVLAMFIVYGNENGPKSEATLQTFARAAIDNVVLVEGVEDSFNTVDGMKTQFANNYQILASAAGGLYANFEFLNNNVGTVDAGELTGATTTREGSGATFAIGSDGASAITFSVLLGGTNYLPGHKILITGDQVGGTSPTNDVIVTVTTATAGEIVGVIADGVMAGPDLQFLGVSGTNYEVGSGLRIASLSLNNDGSISPSVFGFGSNYVTGDVLTLLGTSLISGVSPDNDMTITVTGPMNITVEGTLPQLWPNNNISDGGADQYDNANYINTNLVNQIAYNNGNTVSDGTAFGEGATYSFAYEDSMFALFVRDNAATYVETTGNSGADGGSTTEAGNLLGGGTPQQTFTNAVTHLNVVGTPWAGPTVTFIHSDNGDEVDILIEDDGEGAGVGITRDGNNGIYNPYREGSWDSDVSPGGTQWNIDGWTDLSDVESRNYLPLYAAFGFGGLGNKIVGTECVMYLPNNGKYYAVKFDSWTQGSQGGGFAYTRREINLTKLEEGVRFADGTILKSAEGIGRVKLESTGNRRIEEVYGYKSVAVTSRDRQEITGATYTNVNAYELRVKKTTEINAFISPYYNTPTTATWYISFDNVTFRPATLNGDGGNNWMFYYVNANNPTIQVEDAPFYIRRDVGGDPVAWWDAADLPRGSSNFRGAIIKYHAYISDSGTMIGTIHIAKDSGDYNVAHTEVLSGGSDGENVVLWYQDDENQLKYQRIDGENSTVKVQWSATVFYGSEYWD